MRGPSDQKRGGPATQLASRLRKFQICTTFMSYGINRRSQNDLTTQGLLIRTVLFPGRRLDAEPIGSKECIP